jgi:lipoprotein-anchoring transpeptidase ErfK/SrfK
VNNLKSALGVSLLCALAAAGVFAAYALAEDPPPGTTTTVTTTTATTTTATTTTTPTPAALPEGVTVGGVPVGGLLPSEATAQLQSYFASPLKLALGKRIFAADPTTLAQPQITKALGRARTAKPFANVALPVTVRSARVQSFVKSLAQKIDTKPVDSRLLLRGTKPFVTPDRPGITLVRKEAAKEIIIQLRENVRERLDLPTEKARATLTRETFGPVVVIRRGLNRLFLYHGMRLFHVFPVATGQRVYPTPLGQFKIIVKWRNPWWYPPASPWAVGEKPVPPGPGNPLGTRWMGISSPGVGIHGTNNDASIGYSVSHGCIRMHVHDAEWLFNHVEIGTPVFIVAG